MPESATSSNLNAPGAVLRLPEVKKLVFAQGTEVIGSSPAEFAAWLKSDTARWSKLIREKGLRKDR